jgi:hypothetical protein
MTYICTILPVTMLGYFGDFFILNFSTYYDNYDLYHNAALRFRSNYVLPLPVSPGPSLPPVSLTHDPVCTTARTQKLRVP